MRQNEQKHAGTEVRPEPNSVGCWTPGGGYWSASHWPLSAIVAETAQRAVAATPLNKRLPIAVDHGAPVTRTSREVAQPQGHDESRHANAGTPSALSNRGDKLGTDRLLVDAYLSSLVTRERRRQL